MNKHGARPQTALLGHLHLVSSLLHLFASVQGWERRRVRARWLLEGAGVDRKSRLGLRSEARKLRVGLQLPALVYESTR